MYCIKKSWKPQCLIKQSFLQKKIHKRSVSEAKQFRSKQKNQRQSIFGHYSPDRFKKFMFNDYKFEEKLFNSKYLCKDRPKSCRSIKLKKFMLIDRSITPLTQDLKSIETKKIRKISTQSFAFQDETDQIKLSFTSKKLKNKQSCTSVLQTIDISLSSFEYQKRKNSQNEQQNKKKLNKSVKKINNKINFLKSRIQPKSIQRQKSITHNDNISQNISHQNTTADSSLQIHLSVQSTSQKGNIRSQEQRIVEIYQRQKNKLLISKVNKNKPIIIKLNKKKLQYHKNQQLNGCSFMKISSINTDNQRSVKL